MPPGNPEAQTILKMAFRQLFRKRSSCRKAVQYRKNRSFADAHAEKIPEVFHHLLAMQDDDRGFFILEFPQTKAKKTKPVRESLRLSRSVGIALTRLSLKEIPVSGAQKKDQTAQTQCLSGFPDSVLFVRQHRRHPTGSAWPSGAGRQTECRSGFFCAYGRVGGPVQSRGVSPPPGPRRG